MLDTSKVKSREQLADFVLSLYRDFVSGNYEWENDNLASFLEALSAYLRDIPNLYQNLDIDVDPDECSWRLIADVFAGARIYE
jgi:hypothetical protein